MSEKTLYPAYDPNKQYKWEPEDTFEITGKEFGLLLNTVRGILSTQEAAHLRLVLQCNDAIEALMKKSVEEGKVVEIPPGEMPKNPGPPAGMKLIK